MMKLTPSEYVARNPRPRGAGHQLVIVAGRLRVTLDFLNKEDVQRFVEAGTRCLSIDGMTHLYNGKFQGGRDGGGS